MEAKEEFMQRAIEAAKKAAKLGDYAVGSVIVKDNKIISVGYDTLKTEPDPVNGHAEIAAIRKACKKLNQHYLEGCMLYSTHEPCPMCAAAAIWAKMKGIVYGASMEDFKNNQGENFSWRLIELSCKDVLSKGTPRLELIEKFMKNECVKLFKLSQ